MSWVPLSWTSVDLAASHPEWSFVFPIAAVSVAIALGGLTQYRVSKNNELNVNSVSYTPVFGVFRLVRDRKTEESESDTPVQLMATWLLSVCLLQRIFLRDREFCFCWILIPILPRFK